MIKQKGISQIFIMIAMLVLAIALPVTINLVKNAQDKRSSAASTCNCQCADTTPMGSTCTNSCNDVCAGAMGTCTPGSTKCMGAMVVTCLSTGAGWEGGTSCPTGCSNGACSANGSFTDPGCTANCSLTNSGHCYGESYIGNCGQACTGEKKATDDNCASKANYCNGEYYGTYNGCGNSLGCIGTKVCTYGCNSTTKQCKECISGTKQCSSDGKTAQVCKTDGSGWIDTSCGTTGCNSTTKVCNLVSTPTPTLTLTPTLTPTPTPTSSNNNYTAPNLNLLFSISGVKKVNSCFGDLKFKISVTKDGSDVITTREVTATAVDNKFSTSLEDQVFKISDFALTSDYALTDKIKITIGSSRKTLATIYGKDSQTSGYPALNTSAILVSDLVSKTLSLYDYPVLNGDIGSESSLGTQDNVVNGIDFAFMKNQWGNTCNSGENLVADLNGDCRVDTFDLQILKNAMGEQYAQKTD